jgi:WD40-like Beta Propeller Repeat
MDTSGAARRRATLVRATVAGRGTVACVRRMLVACVAVGAGAVICAGCGGGHHARMELLVRSDRDGGLALYALKRSGAVRRIVGLPLGVGPVSVSTDGRRLLVDGPRLEVLSSTGEMVSAIGRSEPIAGLDAAISPDGSRVVYPSGGGLAIESVGGARAALRGSNAGAPAWSPDGDRVAYTGPSQLFVADADGRRAVAIAPMFVAQSLPAWSPDGMRLAYASPASASSEVSDLWVVRARSHAKPLRVARDVYGTAAWSPDGRLLAFTRFVGSQGAAVAIVGSDGRGERLLATADSLGDATPTWSPDGRDVVYGRFGRVDSVWSVAVRGGRPQRLTPFRDGNNEIVGWVRAAAEREPAPRPRIVRSPRATTLEVPWVVDELAAGPSGIVVAPESSGAGSDARPPLLAWSPGRSPRRIFAADCSGAYAQMFPRVAAAGVVFDCDRSGPDTIDQSLRLVTSSGARRQFFHSVVGAGENYTGTFFNRLEGDGRLVVFDTVTQITKTNAARVTAKRLWRLDGSTPKLLRSGTGLGDPVSVDRGRILLQGGAAGLELVSVSGRTLLRLRVFRRHELRYDSPPRAAVTGDRIAVVLGHRLVAFDATTGRRRASWPLPHGRVQLDGAADGRVALVRGDDVIVLSLATGRVAHVQVPHRDLRPIRRLGYFRTVVAAIAPDGLVYAYDVAKPPYGRVVFLPLSVLRFR